VAKHQNKHIREAIKYAEQHGWNFEKSRGHIYGTLRCPTHGGCRQPVYSTPKHPEDHAKDIRKVVDRCPHQAANGETDDDEV